MMKMPAYKNKDTGTWYVVTQYTDWTGERKQKCKRGVSTRREALEWEQLNAVERLKFWTQFIVGNGLN